MSSGDRDPKYLYLTTTGRVTGLAREIEIWFVQSGRKFYILAEHFHEAQWVKNIVRNSRVRIRVGNQAFEATARVLDETRDKAAWVMVRALLAEKYGWGDGLPVEITQDKG